MGIDNTPARILVFIYPGQERIQVLEMMGNMEMKRGIWNGRATKLY